MEADDRLFRPAALATATDAYLAGEDLMGQFLAEWRDRDAKGLESSADLFAAWRAFARRLGEPPAPSAAAPATGWRGSTGTRRECRQR